jgi:DNA (cytosine-5)-methyltransferase 1
MVRTLDLFCGGGGSSWGASAAGAEILGAVDAWNIAANTFADNFPTAEVSNTRLHRGSNSRIFKNIDGVDLLIASPECTNHTCARGKAEWDESSRETALHVLNYVSAFEPRWLVIENVAQMRNWSRYTELLEKLRSRYYVTPQILDASDFGVPQSRRRLFLVCDRENEPPNLSKSHSASLTAASSILDPAGTWNAGPLFTPKRAKDTVARAERAIKQLGKNVSFLIVYYSTDGGGGWQTLDRPLRTLTTVDRFGLVEWQNGEATLRMLQVPELKRAMGFDFDYELSQGTRRDRVKLLGNGVCPPVMRAIVSSLTGEAASPVDKTRLLHRPNYQSKQAHDVVLA